MDLMSKSIVLLVYGDGDYGAMTFEDNYDPKKVYKEMVAEGVTEKDLIYEHPQFGEEEIHCEFYEFGEVDEKFVSFIIDEFIDYDNLKGKCFYFVEEKQ
jgi:hypothetical protein